MVGRNKLEGETLVVGGWDEGRPCSKASGVNARDSSEIKSAEVSVSSHFLSVAGCWNWGEVTKISSLAKQVAGDTVDKLRCHLSHRPPFSQNTPHNFSEAESRLPTGILRISGHQAPVSYGAQHNSSHHHRALDSHSALRHVLERYFYCHLICLTLVSLVWPA